jgi:aldose sugar dehydrogenase
MPLIANAGLLPRPILPQPTYEPFTGPIIRHPRARVTGFSGPAGERAMATIACDSASTAPLPPNASPPARSSHSQSPRGAVTLYAMKALNLSIIIAALVLAPGLLPGQTVQQLWTDNCLACHGDRGQGGQAQTLLRPDLVGQQHDLRLFEAIRNGNPETGMPGFAGALEDPQMWGLVVHLREQQEREIRRQTPRREPDAQGVVETQHHRYRIERVIEDGLSIPWALAFLPDGGMLIAERPGTLRIHQVGRLGEPIAGTPEVTHRGQGGLMGIALHPQNAENGWVYLSYNHENNGMMTRLVRGRIADGRWTAQETIYEAPPETYVGGGVHFGCRIVFDNDGYLFFVIGDRGRQNDAQQLNRPNGKVHRLHDDGRVPEDNPFVDVDGALPSIWSYGHRNPQGLVYDAETNELWSTEHGPRGGDELNLVTRGGNYGWPRVSHAINYNGNPLATPFHDGDYIDPVLHWTPSIAACGLAQVRGDAFPQWRGDLLAGGLAGQVVERLRLSGGEVVERERIFERMGRVRDVVMGPDGAVYIALNGPDHVVRLVPANSD